MALDTGGNVKVDFVWGNFPMQPDDERTGNGSSTLVVSANAAQNNDWSGYSVKLSPALEKGDITVALSPGITTVVKNNHSVALNNWNGFPDYTPVNPYLDTTDQAAIPNVVGVLEAAATSTLTGAGFVKGAVTTTGVGATTVNDGLVKTQTPAATTVANLGTAVALVKYAAPLVPNVIGLGNMSAQASIEAAGLVYAEGATTTDGATAENDGLVASVSPTVGTKVNTGSTVTVSLYEFAG